MKFSISLAAVAAILPSAFAHVSMTFPAPFVGGADSVSPLSDTGSNYPCMAPNYDLESQLTIQPGESGQIVLGGSAPHGGGSCQISLTYDMQPNAGSRFTVIKSFQGACPVAAAGNEVSGPYTLPYTIPKDAPSGKAVLAWTWFNRRGNREMYMRCSPITIGGSNSDVSTFSQRPEIFKANIGNISNGCATKEDTNVNFPNPGEDVVGQGDAPSVGNCGGSGSDPIPVPKPSDPIAPGNGNGPVIKLPTPVESPAEKPTTPVETETPVETPVQTPVQTPVEDEKPVESPVEDEKPVESPVEDEKPVESPVEDEKPVEDEEPIVAKPISPPAIVAPETPVAAPSTPPSKDAVACDKPGSLVCTSESTFALCNFGFLVPMGRTAMGTKCVDGQISKRAYPIRLSGHIRRRHGKF